jgi:hydrogenase maturation protein HypF
MSTVNTTRTRISTTQRLRLHVTGVVQGVGFRPFVYTLAHQLGLSGLVGNDSSGVFIEVEGLIDTLEDFRQKLLENAPPLARIDTVTIEKIPTAGNSGFSIMTSAAQPGKHTLISPDLAICEDCLRELFDPRDRRYRYPFINCTNCGPRFTIIRDIPYDRPQTTMAGFSMCPACRAEYDDPTDRRFHAQPIACSKCGPQIALQMRDGTRVTGDTAMQAARDALRAGRIVAVKGLGGFHLACDATSSAAVNQLRQRKGRGAKPFAVMMRDLTTVSAFAQIDDGAAELIASHERPIVLLPKRMSSQLAEEVAPGNPDLGVMLPYTPLHYLLIDDRPLVMTSGNRSEEPIITDNDAALTGLAAIADMFLLHDRDIHAPCDDSVLRVFDGAEFPIRRSRGYAPYPVRLPFELPPVLAIGGELKNTFCLTHGDHAFMSQHIGDMENLETIEAFRRAVTHMAALFRIQPDLVACDLHPAYFSSRLAAEYAQQWNLPLKTVQHHHAHIAAVMAEHKLDGSQPVIGVSFDGTGYGTDGAIWGGEFLVADYGGFHRAAHLAYVPLPGGDAAIRHPYRLALAHLWAAGLDWDDALPPVAVCSPEERRILQRQLETGLNTVPTSSMGRLFDAVAALIGLCQTISYEAQAAIELQAATEDSIDNGYAFDIRAEETGTLLIEPAPVLRAIIEDWHKGTGAGIIAARFHVAVAAAILEVCRRLRDQHDLNTVALSGGVFQNTRLLALTQQRLRAQDFDVRIHHQVPANDGGLALGQAAIAGAAMRQSAQK